MDSSTRKDDPRDEAERERVQSHSKTYSKCDADKIKHKVMAQSLKSRQNTLAAYELFCVACSSCESTQTATSWEYFIESH